MSIKNRRVLIIIILFIAIWVGCTVIDNSKNLKFEPIESSAFSDIELPDKRIIAIGTPTHGNAEPFKLTLDILCRIYEKHGCVAFILEENVGDAEIINVQHSYTKGDGTKVGMYLVYENNEMSEILNWLKRTNQRFYGIDIQSISETAHILRDALKNIKFSSAEKVLDLPTTSKQKIKDNIHFLDVIEEYIKEQKCKLAIPEQNCTYLLHLLDCIRMNYEYVLSGYSFEIRDKMMAKNVEWVMDYEKKYFDNYYAVLFASNGHVIKSSWSYEFSKEFYDPMGSLLSEKYNEEYFLILTDAYENYFEASTNMLRASNKKVFHIYNDYLHSFFDVNGGRVNIIESINCSMEKNKNWKLVIIGSVFSPLRELFDTYYIANVSLENSCDIILCFEIMSPVQRNTVE